MIKSHETYDPWWSILDFIEIINQNMKDMKAESSGKVLNDLRVYSNPTKTMEIAL